MRHLLRYFGDDAANAIGRGHGVDLRRWKSFPGGAGLLDLGGANCTHSHNSGCGESVALQARNQPRHFHWDALT